MASSVRTQSASSQPSEPGQRAAVGRHWLIITVAGALLYFVNLGATRLWDVDEAIFTRAAVEMAERGDWVTPYYNGEMFGHKPPWMYWCQMVAFQLFGTTEFAARFFSAIFSIGTLLVTYELGRALFNARTGLWAALALGSCINFAVISRAATPDAYLTFFCTLVLLVLVLGTRDRTAATANGAAPWQPRLPGGFGMYALAHAVLALAVLVKGPIIGGILPLAVWGMFLLVEQRRQSGATAGCTRWWKEALAWFSPVYFLQTTWRMRPLLATALILLIAGPWYVLVGLRTDGEFLRQFFMVHNFGRAAQAMDSHSGPIFYYLLAVCIGTFPWCVLLGPTLGYARQLLRLDSPHRPAMTLLACWVGVWIGILSLASTKLPSYIIPCYPALALGFGALIDHWLTAGATALSRHWLRAAWSTLAVVGVGMLVAVPIITHHFLDGEWLPGLVGLIPLTAAFIGLWLSEQGRLQGSLRTLALSGVASCIAILGVAVLPIDAHQNCPSLAEFVHQHSTGIPQVAAHKYLPPSLVYYHGAPVQNVGTAEELAQFFVTHPEDAFLVTTSSSLKKLADELPPGITVLHEERRFLREGNVVVLGRTQSREVARNKAAVIR